MKSKIFIVLLGALLASGSAIAKENDEHRQSNKTAGLFCSTNEDCIDVVAMELDALYFQGLNESHQTTMGTLINRKDRSLKDYCAHTKDKAKDMCELYKNQLMIKYMSGLLNR